MEARDLRVALFTGNYNYVRDGANQALNRLVGHLLSRGAAVRVYSPTVPRPAFSPTGDLVSVPSVALPGRAEYRAPVGLPRRVRADVAAFRPNLVHVASPEILGHRAVSLARELGVPVAASVHTRFESYLRYYRLGLFEPALLAMLRRFYRRCDAIFAPSESMARLLREQRMNSRVGIWSRGIDHALFAPGRRDEGWRAAQGFAPDLPVIVFLGRLVVEKGLDTFAAAIDALAARSAAHGVLVIGDGPARAAFEAALPRARFTGFLTGSELGRALAGGDVLLNPSVTETFGNVTLEAMASGLPVVAAHAPGSASLVEHGRTGLLVRPDDVAGYADALERYCRDPAARAAAGAAGAARSERYGWDAVNGALVDEYLRLAAGRG